MAGVSSDSLWISAMWSSNPSANPNGVAVYAAQAQAQTQAPSCFFDLQDMCALGWSPEAATGTAHSEASANPLEDCSSTCGVMQDSPLELDAFPTLLQPDCAHSQLFLNRGTEAFRNPLESLRFLYSAKNDPSPSPSPQANGVKDETNVWHDDSASFKNLGVFHAENQLNLCSPTTTLIDLDTDSPSSLISATPLGSDPPFTSAETASFIDDFTANVLPPRTLSNAGKQMMMNPVNPVNPAPASPSLGFSNNASPSAAQNSQLQQILQQAKQMNNANTSNNTLLANEEAHKEQKKHTSDSCSSLEPLMKRPRLETITQAPATFKVRKEKLGDRITVLQQLVSPFGKTDTASVLLEAIGYIKYLHEQVQVLSTPCIHKATSLTSQHQHQERQDHKDCGKDQDLRSRGLCLVPLSSTLDIAAAAAAVADPCANDFWSPSLAYGLNFLS
eukprot:TRINITY_DN4687_c0_g1_i3.p1 TRINITY_DN4687_c0_g1~~TRINITY_DN4687_c0_g1_i3.p1  ORF type:complete len:446 (-),score=13.11 TRINITY_DN4687_c0_g1_i3:266-1603(-)